MASFSSSASRSLSQASPSTWSSDMDRPPSPGAPSCAGAPQWIIDAHAPDQGPQIGLDLRPTAKASGFPAPIPAKAGTMPAHDGLGPDDRDDLEDRRKPTIELDQE